MYGRNNYRSRILIEKWLETERISLNFGNNHIFIPFLVHKRCFFFVSKMKQLKRNANQIVE